MMIFTPGFFGVSIDQLCFYLWSKSQMMKGNKSEKSTTEFGYCTWAPALSLAQPPPPSAPLSSPPPIHRPLSSPHSSFSFFHRWAHSACSISQQPRRVGIIPTLPGGAVAGPPTRFHLSLLSPRSGNLQSHPFFFPYHHHHLCPLHLPLYTQLPPPPQLISFVCSKHRCTSLHMMPSRCNFGFKVTQIKRCIYHYRRNTLTSCSYSSLNKYALLHQ